ncbi:hypothetical protein GQ42DRAFT_86792 [Ramicandelaber brevisporus]|nr:hypothetical protein GQ42DRAFT_86792 [Ramicandelaber brevisporus]
MRTAACPLHAHLSRIWIDPSMCLLTCGPTYRYARLLICSRRACQTTMQLTHASPFLARHSHLSSSSSPNPRCTVSGQHSLVAATRAVPCVQNRHTHTHTRIHTHTHTAISRSRPLVLSSPHPPIVLSGRLLLFLQLCSQAVLLSSWPHCHPCSFFHFAVLPATRYRPYLSRSDLLRRPLPSPSSINSILLPACLLVSQPPSPQPAARASTRQHTQNMSAYNVDPDNVFTNPPPYTGVPQPTRIPESAPW